MTDALDELPQHKVFLDAYFIDKREVSNADYTKFVEATGHRNSIFWDNPKFNHPGSTGCRCDMGRCSCLCRMGWETFAD